MAKTGKRKDDEQNIAKNIKDQYENLFSEQDEPPALSLREAEIMKARISELETKLAQQEAAGFGSQVSNDEQDAPGQPQSLNGPHQKASPEQAAGHQSSNKPAQEKPSFLRSLLRAPNFGDNAKNRIARLQYQIMMGLLATAILAIAVALVFFNSRSITGLVIISVVVGLLVLAIYWQRQGHLQLVSWVLVGVIYSTMLLSLFTGSFSSTSVMELAVVVTLTGLLLRPVQVAGVTLLSVITLVVIPRLGMPGSVDPTQAIYSASILGLEGILLTLASNSLERSFRDVEISTRTLVTTNRELQDLTTNLEQHVASRTHDLELAAEVGRAITEKVANLSSLFSQATDMIRSRFDFYYTQIYMVDPSGRNLVLRAGTGSAGIELLRRSHHLAISSNSLNGRAAAERRAVIVEDTLKNSSFLPNPLLPLTRSEMAIPLIANGKVVGVLDMQSERPDTFTEANLPAFEVLAGQFAIAIQNAALFDEADQARADLEEQAGRLSAAGWHDYLNAVDRSEKLGFVFNQNEILPLVETQAATFENALTAPIQVSGATIGEIQLADSEGRTWTQAEVEIVQATVANVARHIENLRLLSQAESYRAEAEQASQRLTREGWGEFLSTHQQVASGYVYDENQVCPLNGDLQDISKPLLSYPLVVRDEKIGELAVDGDPAAVENSEIITAVAEQLSSHIENLRLSLNNLTLLKSTEERAMREQNLRQITNALRSSTNPETILRTAARELGSILGRKTVVQMASLTNKEQIESRTKDGNGSGSTVTSSPIEAVGGNE